MRCPYVPTRCTYCSAGLSAGVNPITCTPAPWAMSIASMTSWYFRVPAAPPRALALADVPAPEPIRLELERIRLPRDEVATSVRADARPGTGTEPGQGTGAGGGQGSGVGTGAGADAGPGTGEEGSYILLASPRWAILPPANPPAAVRGRPLRVQFWVSAEGRVTRVEVDPPIKDAAYRREFMERMQGYLFTPAITRDGRRVASVYPMTLTP